MLPHRCVLGGASGKEPACQCRWKRIWSLGWEDLLEEGVATHSSILAWRIPWTEEPGRLQSLGSHRVSTTKATEQALTQSVSFLGSLTWSWSSVSKQWESHCYITFKSLWLLPKSKDFTTEDSKSGFYQTKKWTGLCHFYSYLNFCS